MTSWLIAAAAAFLVGSIPFGYIIARSKGVDIRAHGSGNIGATNVLRVLGRGPGLLCFALDILKGLAPTLAAGIYHNAAARFDVAEQDAWLWLLVMVAPVLGHMFTPWLGFRGGKGVATGLGSLVAVFPVLTAPALGAVVVFIISAKITKYVGVSSVAAACSIPLFTFVGLLAAGELPRATSWLVVTAALALVVTIKHRANIARTLAGTEHRIGERAGPR